MTQNVTKPYASASTIEELRMLLFPAGAGTSGLGKAAVDFFIIECAPGHGGPPDVDTLQRFVIFLKSKGYN